MDIGGVTVALHLHPEVLALCVGLLAGYAGLVARYGRLMHPRPGERAVRPRQVVAFAAGVAALWVASGSPLHDLAERHLYSAHMVQHLIQAFVVPPLLLLGVPTWMGEVLLRPRALRWTVQRLASPLVAALLFNGVMLAIHWPAVVDLMLASEVWHAVSHVVLIVTGLLLWVNVVNPVPHVIAPLTPLQKMGFLFVQSILPTVPASFLTFGDTPLYTAYADFAAPWGISTLTDMRTAGLLMKTGAGFVLWIVIAILFFRWAAAEERQESPHGPTPVGSPPSTDLLS